MEYTIGETRLESQFVAFRRTWWPAIRQEMEDVVSTTLSNDSPIRRMFLYHLNTGGKRLRAILPLLIAESLGTPAAKIVPFAAACEMLHNASLVHDDIQDGDSLRRGNLTVWKKFGMAQAINLGDAMIAFTLCLSDRLDVPAALREKAKKLILSEMLRVIDGQAVEFDLQQNFRPCIDDYIRMVEGKTSSLFSLPVGGAALLSEASKEVEEALVESASQIGVLFQIQDDLMDLFSDDEMTVPGQDVREGKLNILTIHFMQNAKPEDVRWLMDILEKPVNGTTMDDVQAVRDAFTVSGSLDFALSEISSRKEAALAFPRLDTTEFAATAAVLKQACDMFLTPIRDMTEKMQQKKPMPVLTS